MSIEKYMVRLYPRSWRQRYEEEVLAMLEDCPGSCLDTLDLLFGALDAHLHPHLGTASMPLFERMKQMLSLLRRSLLMMFCAYIGFVLAGIAFQKLTESRDFAEAASMHSIIGLSFNLVGLGALVTLLAVLAGGLPIALSILRNALTQKRYGSLLLLAVPFLACVAFFGILNGLEAIPLSDRHLAPLWQTFLPRGIFLGVLLAAVIVSTGALCCAFARSEIPTPLLRFAVLPSLLMTLAMTLILAATLVWGLSLSTTVPQLFNSNEGIFGTSTSATWLKIVVIMAITTTLAVISFIRGHSAHTTLRETAA